MCGSSFEKEKHPYYNTSIQDKSSVTQFRWKKRVKSWEIKATYSVFRLEKT